MYFFAALLGRQYLIPRGEQRDNSTFAHLGDVSYSNTDPFKDHTPDLFFPFFTVIEFLCYMGWIKVISGQLATSTFYT